MTIRILIADDHALIRSGIRSELSRHPGDFLILGEATSGDEALSMCRQLQPDLLLLDVNMPGRKPIEILQEVKEQAGCRVLVVTAFGEVATILGMLRAGADGYLLKEDDPTLLLEAIQGVMRGETWLSHPVSEKLIASVTGKNDARLGGKITRREQEILSMIAEGSTNKEIASAIGISERTVEFHVSNILAKSGMKGRWEAVAWAKEIGAISQ